jgi:hypothetical protein
VDGAYVNPPFSEMDGFARKGLEAFIRGYS